MRSGTEVPDRPRREVRPGPVGTGAVWQSDLVTRIAHLTESGLLTRIVPALTRPPAVEVGPGDDAAVVRLASPRVVVTTDTLTQDHDFLLRATTGARIGRKAAVQNLADIAAMGAHPVALVVSVSAPGSTEVAFLEDLSAGLAARAERDGASVVGGDLGAADALSVTVTALGQLREGQAPILRSGARAGDVLAVGSPSLGRSAAGLAWILAERDRETGARDLVAWHDAPDPDLSLGWTAARRADGTAIATAMLDISDGLVRDGRRLATASGVTIDLERDVLAHDVAQLADAGAALGADPWTWVLHGGEEHAMLATFPADEVPPGFRRIGTCGALADGAGAEVLLDGGRIEGAGFDHFA